MFPTAWWLPPLLGLLPQLVVLRHHLLTRPVTVPFRPLAGDVVRGLLLGAVLWGDKLVYFLADPDGFAVQTVFLALLPAVLAYNFYFIRVAPGFDSSVAALRHATGEGADRPSGAVLPRAGERGARRGRPDRPHGGRG